MSTGTIIAIVVGALVLIAIVALISRAGQRRKLDTRREQAGTLREGARERTLKAEHERSLADEQAARAKGAEAEAEEKAAMARRESASAQDRAQGADHEQALAHQDHREAREIDPDVSDEDPSAAEGATRDRHT